tara:strand:+ start:2497 stop:3447 length:951 start_codon:yes stop_codon:yes gene_type:complete
MNFKISFNCKNCNYWNWNGFKIAWYVENESKGIPIILLHGFGANSKHWRKNINIFVDKGYAVYAIDLLGFGFSDQPGIKQIGVLDNGIWCDQVTDFIKEIIRPINPNKVVIIGNSLGGLVALTCAAFIPEEISGIIASPLPDPITIKMGKINFKSTFQALKINIINLFVRILPIRLILFVINRSGLIHTFLNFAYFKKDAIDKDLLEIVKNPSKRETAARSLRAMCLGMATRSEKLKSSFLLKIINKVKKVPFLLMWGEKDNFIPLFYGKRIAKLYPWVELKVIPNSGHCVHDEDHHIFNKISTSWIKELNTLKNK